MERITTLIGKGLSSMTTYNFGIVQTKLYRQLKQRTTKVLSQTDITPNEWATMGFLYDNPAGIRPARLADEIGVEPPFVTLIIKSLTAKSFITQVPDETDSRAKKICITKVGKAFVKDMEPQLRTAMRPAMDGVSLRELLTYYKVMRKMSKNIEEAIW